MEFIDKIKNGIIENKGYFIILGGVFVIVIIVMALSEGMGGLFGGFLREDLADQEAPPEAVLTFEEEEAPAEEVPEEEPPPSMPPIIMEKNPEEGDVIPRTAGNVLVKFMGGDLTANLNQDVIIRVVGTDVDIADMEMSFSPADILTIPYPILEYGTEYEVILPKEIVATDTATLEEDFTWSFLTEDAPVVAEEVEEEEEEVAVVVDEVDEGPPTLTGIILETESADISILDHSVSPESFNPLTAETKISFETSAEAEIELKIVDLDGSTVVTLIDDDSVEGGEHFAWWKGTDSTSDEGTVVDPGTYYYKITAKDPATSERADSVIEEIIVAYTVAGDFEDEITETRITTTVPVDDTQGRATIVMQSTTGTQTSDTGPETLIYLLFPLVGFILTRKKLI